MKPFIVLITFSLLILGTNTIHNDEALRIKQLIEHFNEKGIDIKPMINDPDFALVNNIADKFKNAVEIKIASFENYKKRIKYNRKKDKIKSFYTAYKKDLKFAESQYNIPKEVIIGILAIESEFGRYKGSYNPFNVYVSMYVYGYRSKWAVAQLEELLEFSKNKKLDLFEMKSSYAGAMGYAQFIPWSLNRFWVGSELYNMTDNINSIANFLAHYKNVTNSLDKAILRYNPSSMYKKAVLGLAKNAEESISH